MKEMYELCYLNGKEIHDAEKDLMTIVMRAPFKTISVTKKFSLDEIFVLFHVLIYVEYNIAPLRKHERAITF